MKFIGAFSPGTSSVNCAFYIRVPFLGRVRLTNIIGDLKNGIQVEFDVFVAKGKVRLFLLDDEEGKKGLHADIEISTESLGNFNDTVKILTLPCAFSFSFIFLNLDLLVRTMTNDFLARTCNQHLNH